MQCNRLCCMNDPDKGCLLGGVEKCAIGSEQVIRRAVEEAVPSEQRRLIDANALKYTRVRIFHGMLDNGEPLVGGFNAVVMSCAIKDAPTVDAVEVVRCEYCKHAEECICVVCEDGETIVCSKTRRHMKKTDFCSYGDRRAAENQRDLGGYVDKLREIKEGV